jgi:hypothetical protein
MFFSACNFEELNDAFDLALERSQYGNWCGPHHSGDASTPAIDSLDEQCKTHDQCYDTVPVADEDYYQCAPGAKVTCDQTFVNNLNALGDDPAAWPNPPAPENREKAKTYRIDAIKIFGSCVDMFL